MERKNHLFKYNVRNLPSKPAASWSSQKRDRLVKPSKRKNRKKRPQETTLDYDKLIHREIPHHCESDVAKQALRLINLSHRYGRGGDVQLNVADVTLASHGKVRCDHQMMMLSSQRRPKKNLKKLGSYNRYTDDDTMNSSVIGNFSPSNTNQHKQKYPRTAFIIEKPKPADQRRKREPVIWTHSREPRGDSQRVFVDDLILDDKGRVYLQLDDLPQKRAKYLSDAKINRDYELPTSVHTSRQRLKAQHCLPGVKYHQYENRVREYPALKKSSSLNFLSELNSQRGEKTNYKSSNDENGKEELLNKKRRYKAKKKNIKKRLKQNNVREDHTNGKKTHCVMSGRAHEKAEKQLWVKRETQGFSQEFSISDKESSREIESYGRSSSERKYRKRIKRLKKDHTRLKVRKGQDRIKMRSPEFKRSKSGKIRIREIERHKKSTLRNHTTPRQTTSKVPDWRRHVSLDESSGSTPINPNPPLINNPRPMNLVFARAQPCNITPQLQGTNDVPVTLIRRDLKAQRHFSSTSKVLLQMQNERVKSTSQRKHWNSKRSGTVREKRTGDETIADRRIDSKKRKKKKNKSKKQEHKKTRWKISDCGTPPVDHRFDPVVPITAEELYKNSQIKNISHITEHKASVKDTCEKYHRLDNSQSPPRDNITPSGRRQSYTFVAPRDLNNEFKADLEEVKETMDLQRQQDMSENKEEKSPSVSVVELSQPSSKWAIIMSPIVKDGSASESNESETNSATLIPHHHSVVLEDSERSSITPLENAPALYENKDSNDEGTVERNREYDELEQEPSIVFYPSCENKSDKDLINIHPTIRKTSNSQDFDSISTPSYTQEAADSLCRDVRNSNEFDNLSQHNLVKSSRSTADSNLVSSKISFKMPGDGAIIAYDDHSQSEITKSVKQIPEQSDTLERSNSVLSSIWSEACKRESSMSSLSEETCFSIANLRSQPMLTN